MRAIWGWWACVLGLVSLSTGCSSSDGAKASLDCAWLAGQNCWKTTASLATSCLPPKAETGVLSADNSKCSYASGSVVTFAPPLVLPVPDSPNWNFTIANAAQPCLQYQESDTGFKLTVGDQTVSEALSGPIGLQIECPGGATYSNSNAFDLLNCGSDAGVTFGGLPGNAYSDTATSVSFSLIGASPTSSELSLFNCGK
ncbi:MAG: hypothetical protein ABW061_03370 [Polyangiaceae bacterium]